MWPPYDYEPAKYRFKDTQGNFKVYDSRGRLMSYGNRFGTTASLTYDSDSTPVPSGIEDQNGTQVFWLEYDTNNNLTRVYTADADEVRYEYTAGNLAKVIDATEDETVYAYDGNNNLVKTVDAAGRATIVTYDKNNDPVSVTDEDGIGHFFEYDYDKNKREYYAAIKTSSGKLKEVWTNEKGETKRVDINGRTVKKIAQDGRDLITTDEKGNRTQTFYDENENLTQIIYPDNTKIKFSYDLRFNKVREITDQLGRITTFEYNDQGSLVKKIQAQGTTEERTTTFTHDEMGRILTAETL